MQDARLSNIVRLWRKVFQHWEKEAAACLQTHDNNVMNVVIIMIFWYVFIGTDLSFFFKLYFELYSFGIDHNPPCSI